jgi:hypothetical protein
LVALVATGSVLASIYNSMSARRRDLAILRALGVDGGGADAAEVQEMIDSMGDWGSGKGKVRYVDFVQYWRRHVLAQSLSPLEHFQAAVRRTSALLRVGRAHRITTRRFSVAEGAFCVADLFFFLYPAPLRHLALIADLYPVMVWWDRGVLR